MLVVGFAVRPVEAQTGIAQVHVNATVQVPEVLRLVQGGTETVEEGDEVVTRSTVFVTANRAWTLSARVQGSDVSDVRIGGDRRLEVSTAADVRGVTGRHGNSIPVVVEIRRPASSDVPQLEWILLPQ